MKHIYSVIMALVTSTIILMPSNVALAQSTGGDGGTADGVVTGGDGATVSSPITIEGDFSDWAALEKELPNLCVSASSDDNARYTGLYKVLFFANNDSLFFYIEYSDSTQVQEAGTYYVTDMINIMLHTGGLSTTGMTIFNDEDVCPEFTNVQIAGSPRTQFANANIFVYQESNQTWEMVELPVSPISACMPVEEETSDYARIEGAIALRQLPVEINELKVGVIGVETGNVTSGVLPQVSLSPSDGVKIIQPMLSVPWSIAGEEEQSGMCGDKVIWTECGTKLVRVEGEAAWRCPNEVSCPPQMKGRLEHFVSRKAMNIEGLGSETIAMLYDKGLLRSIADIYSLRQEDLSAQERLGDKSAQNILQAIEGSKQVPWARVLFALGIRMVGETTAKKIAKRFRSIDALQWASKEELTEIDDVGEQIAENIVAYFADIRNLEIITRLQAAGVQMEDVSNQQPAVSVPQVLSGKTIVISGTFTEHSREEYKQMIEDYGGKNSGSVSKKTDFILAGENMGPSKLEKAQSLGVRLMSEQDFLKVLKGEN